MIRIVRVEMTEWTIGRMFKVYIGLYVIMIGVCLEIKFYAFVAYDVATFCKDVNM